jgi:hypothetical protein
MLGRDSQISPSKFLAVHPLCHGDTYLLGASSEIGKKLYLANNN